MRKLILFIASSLDGYIARSSGAVDWLFTDQDYGYTNFLASIDTVLIGRKTYDQLLTFGEYPYVGKKSFVFSRQSNAGNENVDFINRELIGFIESLKMTNGKNIWLVGGAEIIQLCLQQDLIDEFIISIQPIILGEGMELFRSPLSMKKLKLQCSETFNTGLVQLTYTSQIV
jgi:dihydrofolate reductase